MAPEVLDGKPYSVNSEMYSFAMVLLEIVSRRLPFVEYKRLFTAEDKWVEEKSPSNSLESPEDREKGKEEAETKTSANNSANGQYRASAGHVDLFEQKAKSPLLMDLLREKRSQSDVSSTSNQTGSPLMKAFQPLLEPPIPPPKPRVNLCQYIPAKIIKAKVENTKLKELEKEKKQEEKRRKMRMTKVLVFIKHKAIDEIVSQGLRPSLPKNIDATLSKLITACWNQRESNRPSFKDCLFVLQRL